MAVEQPGFVITLAAAADLSAHQYKFVKLDTDGKAAAMSAATDIPVGVLQNKPSAAGAAAEIMVMGLTKLRGDADLNEADQIGTSSDGQADAKTAGSDTSEYAVGQVVIENTAADGYITALINCCNPHRAA